IRGAKSVRDDVDRLAAALLAELHGPRGLREQRVVAATADVDAGVEVGATLANQDLAGLDDLTAEPLDAEPLGVGVATVAGAGCALLVCHFWCLRWLLDPGDLEHGQLLTMTLPLVIAGLVLELVDANLGALGVLQHLDGDRHLRELGSVGGDVRAVDDQRHRQRHLRAGFGLELLHLEHVAGGDLVLLAAGFEDCVGRHRVFSFRSSWRALPVGRVRVWVRVPHRPRRRPPRGRAWRQLVKGTGPATKASNHLAVAQSSWRGGPAGRAAPRRGLRALTAETPAVTTASSGSSVPSSSASSSASASSASMSMSMSMSSRSSSSSSWSSSSSDSSRSSSSRSSSASSSAASFSIAGSSTDSSTSSSESSSPSSMISSPSSVRRPAAIALNSGCSPGA